MTRDTAGFIEGAHDDGGPGSASKPVQGPFSGGGGDGGGAEGGEDKQDAAASGSGLRLIHPDQALAQDASAVLAARSAAARSQ
jgi:hypothetical protein